MQSSSARQLHEDNPDPISQRRDFSRNPASERYPMQKNKKKRPMQRKKKKAPMYERVMKGSRNMPSILKRGHIYFLVENEASQYRMPKTVITTVIIVFICAMAIILTHAQITGVERQILQYNRELRELEDENMSRTFQLSNRYSLEQIEYIAITKLGMIHPDPSQIIEIYVPPHNNVRLNRAEHLLPSENYFWRDIRTFMNGLLNRIFGGN